MALTKASYSMITGASVNVLDFGADKTGATDSTAAIQNAVNASSAVYFPTGIYLISDVISLNANNYLFGDGTIKRADAGFMFAAESVDDITVKELTFDGDVDSWALNFKSCSNIIVSECRCINIMLVQTTSVNGAYASVTDADLCDGVIISNNTGLAIDTPAAQSQSFIRILYTKNFTVTGNECKGYRDFVLMWGGDGNTNQAYGNARKCYNGSVTGNTGDLLAAGIWGSMCQDVAVIGNTLSQTTPVAEGIGVESCYRVNFEANVVNGFNIGAYVRALYQDILFQNNLITVPAGSFLFYNESNDFYADIGDLTLLGNTMKAIGGYGHFIPYISNIITLQNNYIENSFPQIISSSVNAVIMENNTIVSYYAPVSPSNTLYAIPLGGFTDGFTADIKPKATVKNNIIEYVSGSPLTARGISIFPPGAVLTVNVEISGNTITNFAEAITLETGTGTAVSLIRNNVISTGTTYPQVKYGGTHTVLWQDNYNSSGQDIYGSVSGFSSIPYFSVGSRIWSNSPSSGNAPGWICTSSGQSGTWTAMANLA